MAERFHIVPRCGGGSQNQKTLEDMPINYTHANMYVFPALMESAYPDIFSLSSDTTLRDIITATIAT